MNRVREALRTLRFARPMGLISWRYFWPPALHDPRVSMHRELWLGSRLSKPLMAWIAIQLFGWLRWSLWAGWRNGFASVREMGARTEMETGISIARQRRTVLRLALGWCIPPSEIYRFHLYCRPEVALDYIYDCETRAFHALQTRDAAKAAEQAKLLSDKLAAARRFAAVGVPTVPTLASVPNGATDPLEAWLDAGSVFCKRRSGSGGDRAFAAWPTKVGVRGRCLRGGELADAPAVEAAWRALLAVDDALIQPALTNHPLLAAMSVGGELITARVITRHRGDRAEGLAASLEVPLGAGPRGKARYAILPIDLPTGALLPPVAPPAPDLGWRNGPAKHVPYWNEIVAASLRAHEEVAYLWGVAWDWAITAEHPLLLEGNAGWGLAMPQLVLGPALTRLNRPASG